MNKLIRSLFILVMFVSASLHLHASYTVVEPQSVMGERYPAFTNPLLGVRRTAVSRVDVARYSSTKTLAPLSPVVGPKRSYTVKSVGGGLSSGGGLQSSFQAGSHISSLSSYPVSVSRIASDASYMAVAPDASVHISSSLQPDATQGGDATLGGGSQPDGPSTGQLLPVDGGEWALLCLAFVYLLMLARKREYR